MFNLLRKSKNLPACDDVELPFTTVCLVGQTSPLDPNEFPDLNEPIVQSHSVLGMSTMCTWIAITTKQNTVCWVVVHFLDNDSKKQNDSFRNSEWGHEAAQEMAKAVRTFKVPGGKGDKQLTIGDYIDKTPPKYLSKVMLEEIIFESWYHRRAVLLGDACHKMNPAGGVGAMCAIHDAVALGNWLATLRDPTLRQIENAFEEYRQERFPVAKGHFEFSRLIIRNFGKSVMASIVRKLIAHIPLWLLRTLLNRRYRERPQASFLPLVEDNAKIQPLYQRSLHLTKPIIEKLNKGSQTVSTSIAVQLVSHKL
ncbi:hypothetical protein BG004_007086 [Podila humilis]|nr:hypothetical protein BG004_007086 [Podila humilis]